MFMLFRMDDDLRRKAMMIIALEELRKELDPPKRIPIRDGGETGAEFINRMLTGHPHLCQEQLQLDREIFVKLVADLKQRNLLVDGDLYPWSNKWENVYLLWHMELDIDKQLINLSIHCHLFPNTIEM